MKRVTILHDLNLFRRVASVDEAPRFKEVVRFWIEGIEGEALLDSVYAATNSVNAPWETCLTFIRNGHPNYRDVLLFGKNFRSTSVGDRIRIEDAGTLVDDGVLYEVDRVGFKQVEVVSQRVHPDRCACYDCQGPSSFRSRGDREDFHSDG